MNNSVLKRASYAVRWACASKGGCSEPCSCGGARSCRLTRHLVAPELKLALDVRLPVLAHLVFTLRSRGFVRASVPFESARCLLTRSTPEGELGLGTLHDLRDRAVKEPANERAAEAIYDFLLFGREVHLLESAGDFVTPEPLNRVSARPHRDA